MFEGQKLCLHSIYNTVSIGWNIVMYFSKLTQSKIQSSDDFNFNHTKSDSFIQSGLIVMFSNLMSDIAGDALMHSDYVILKWPIYVELYC